MNILIWTNCQGKFIYDNYLCNLPFFRGATARYQANYGNDSLPSLDYLASCDIVIHQSVDNLQECLGKTKPSCIKICIPVMYADLFPIFGEGGLYVGGETLDKYRHLPLHEVIGIYDRGQYDFELVQRFNYCMKYMIEKEKKCDIKLSDFILANYRKVRLFDTQNHPTGVLGAYAAKEICKFLNIPPPNIDEFTQSHVQVINLAWKDSFYAKKELSLEYVKENDHNHYRELIVLLYNNPNLAKRKYT